MWRRNFCTSSLSCSKLTVKNVSFPGILWCFYMRSSIFEVTHKQQFKCNVYFWHLYKYYMSKRRIPSNYFFKFFIFKLFIGIFHKKSDLIFWCKFKRFLYKIFKAHFILLIHYIVLLSKICQTKKTRALRDIWDRKYNSANVSTFGHGRAILFAPTVRVEDIFGLAGHNRIRVEDIAGHIII